MLVRGSGVALVCRTNPPSPFHRNSRRLIADLVRCTPWKFVACVWPACRTARTCRMSQGPKLQALLMSIQFPESFFSPSLPTVCPPRLLVLRRLVFYCSFFRASAFRFRGRSLRERAVRCSRDQLRKRHTQYCLPLAAAERASYSPLLRTYTRRAAAAVLVSRSDFCYATVSLVLHFDSVARLYLSRPFWTDNGALPIAVVTICASGVLRCMAHATLAQPHPPSTTPYVH